MSSISEQISNGIIPGVVSGLITSIIIYFYSRYHEKVIQPELDDKAYLGVRIDQNKWQITAENTPSDVAEITFTQRATHISGEIIWITKEKTTRYELEGEFNNLILTATYKEKLANNLDRGAITLFYQNNGLYGCYAWYDNDKNEITSGRYECHPVR